MDPAAADAARARHRRRNLRYGSLLLAVYLTAWILLALGPRDRSIWFAENALVVVAVPLAILGSVRIGFSRLAQTCVFVFMLLHALGAHFTYTATPLDPDGAGRNDYDRLVHFAFGLLLAVPAREFFAVVAKARGAWAYYFPIELVLALGALYEMLEWLAVEVAAPQIGAAFLGSQGDEFDSIKDLALAGLGATVTMVGLAIYHRAVRRPAPPVVDP